MDWMLQTWINDDGNYLLFCIDCRVTQVQRKTQALLFPLYKGNVKLKKNPGPSTDISSTQPETLVGSTDMNKIVINCFEKTWRFKINEKYSLWSCMFLFGNHGRAKKKEKGTSGVLDLADILVKRHMWLEYHQGNDLVLSQYLKQKICSRGLSGLKKGNFYFCRHLLTQDFCNILADTHYSNYTMSLFLDFPCCSLQFLYIS